MIDRNTENSLVPSLSTPAEGNEEHILTPWRKDISDVSAVSLKRSYACGPKILQQSCIF